MLALVAAVSLASCAFDHAHYVLRGDPQVTADFRPIDSGGDWPAGLAVRIRFGKSARAYWFLPWDGGTDGLQHLASTTDVEQPGWRPPSPDGGPRPLGDIDYIGTDRGYRVLDAAPHRSAPAAAHMLLPNLGDRTWHANFDAAPKQFFDLTGCPKGR